MKELIRELDVLLHHSWLPILIQCLFMIVYLDLSSFFQNNQFAYREVLNLADYHVEETNNRAVLNREARWSYSWLLVKNDKTVAYTLSVRSAELKTKMMNALEDAM